MYDWTAATRGPRTFEPTHWRRVSRHERCPICGRPDWCAVSEDGSLVICMRVPDGAIRSIDQVHGVGYLHRLDAAAAPAPPPTYTPPADARVWIDFPAVLARYRQDTPRALVEACARELGVDRGALDQLGAVWCRRRRAWAYPMFDDRRRIVGVRFRTPRGRKFALRGSRAGLFLPAGFDGRASVLIAEGPTDAAAGLTLGFEAIGRPSCTGGTAILCDLLGVTRRRDVVIVADADGPGRYGARQLADRLIGLCASVCVIDTAPYKDLRAWLQAGATREGVIARTHKPAQERQNHGERR